MLLHCENLPFFGFLPRLSISVGRAEELRRIQSSDALSGSELEEDILGVLRDLKFLLLLLLHAWLVDHLLLG